MRRVALALLLLAAVATRLASSVPERGDTGRQTGKNADGGWVEGIPVEIDEAARRRGRIRWSGTCMSCHGPRGASTQRSESLLSDRIRAMPDGELFDIITRGRGTMGGQSTFISVDDRWKIIAHLRSLQSDASP